MKKHFRRFFGPSSKGFTLIETAIVLAIASVMVASFMAAERVRVVNDYRQGTLDRIKAIQTAMLKFQSSDPVNNPNKRLPYPASLTAGVGTAAFGVEATPTTNPCAPASPAGTASSNGTICVVNAAIAAANAALATGTPPTPSTVLIGAVPVAALKLPAEDAFDKWGNRFLYGIDQAHADGSASYNPSTGAISLLKGANAAPSPEPFVIVSTGKDRAGGITYEGKSFPVACPTANAALGSAASLEKENCNMDATFIEAPYSEAAGSASFFDDYIVYNLDAVTGGTGGGAKNIDDLDDGISDYPAVTAGNAGATGSYVFLGQNAGTNNTGFANTGVGIEALDSRAALGNGLTNAYGNTALGYGTMPYNGKGITPTTATSSLKSVANYNTALGALALFKNTDGQYNTATGAFALAYNYRGASGNTADGAAALSRNRTGSSNTAIGTRAMEQSQSSSENTAIGNNAMQCALGSGAFAAMAHSGVVSAISTPVSSNTAVGANALQGASCSAQPPQSFLDLVLSASLISTATQSGQPATQAQAALPALALSQATTTTATTATAAQATPSYATAGGGTGSYNTALGHSALAGNDSGFYNTAVGYQAMLSNLGAYTLPTAAGPVYTGTNNTAIGAGALSANSVGNNNTVIGREAMESGVAVSGVTAVGYQALLYANNSPPPTTPDTYNYTFNTAIGYQSQMGIDATSAAANFGLYNTSAGAFSLLSNSGYNNTAVGYQAMNSNLGYYTTAPGTAAAVAAPNTEIADTVITTTAPSPAMLTPAVTHTYSGGSITDTVAITAATTPAIYYTGTNNTALGTGALYTNSSGNENTAVGSGALYFSNANSGSTALGYQALYYADNTTTNAKFTDNTAIGAEALKGSLSPSANTGAGNTAIGGRALFSNLGGAYNTAAGYQAMENNQGSYTAGSGTLTYSGSNNTASGYQAMQNNISGSNNTVNGAQAMQNNSSGNDNTAIGAQSLFSNTVGNQSTAVGYWALYSNTAGSNNTASGWAALHDDQGGADNTAVGWAALAINNGGQDNTAVGLGAGGPSAPGNITGNYNTFIGQGTKTSGTTQWNRSTAIGYGAIIDKDDRIVLGNNTTSDITAHVTNIIGLSDRRQKKDIADSDLGLDFINKLHPVSYRYKTGGDILRYGFIAQEVEQALSKPLQDMVEKASGPQIGMIERDNDKMRTYRLNYVEIISPLVKAIQEIAAKFEALEKIVTDMVARLSAPEKIMQEQQAVNKEQDEKIQSLLQSMAEMKNEIKELRSE